MAKAQQAAHPHGALEAENCWGCHDPHGSPEPKLLAKPERELCLHCHDDVKQQLAKRSVHNPLQQGQCGKCHEPHGGKEACAAEGQARRTLS